MNRVWTRLLLGVGALSLLVLAGCPTTPTWKKTTLSLQAEGIAYFGDKAGQSKWVGTGFWVEPGIIATNAHVASRATQLYGQDDHGNKFRFTSILALDRAGDIAILRADRVPEIGKVQLMSRPRDPRDLRGRDIVVVGNTGGLGLSYYEGKITNVVSGGHGNEQILHNTNTAGGASGGPMFDKTSESIIGINHSSAPSINAKIASSAWRIRKNLDQGKKAYGKDLRDVFTLRNALNYTRIGLNRRYCVGPGQKVVVSFNVPRATDIVVVVQPTQQGQLHIGGLVQGGRLIWKGAFRKKVILPFALGSSGRAGFVVVAPKNGPPRTCGAVGVGVVAWELGIK